MDFGQHAITRRLLVSFMDFFAKIQVEKYSSVLNGYVTRKILKVPVQFAARDKWLEIYKSSSARKAMDPTIREKNPVEMQWILPRIGVQMNGILYDAQRKLIKTQQIQEYNSETSSSKAYTPSPWNLDIDVYVISKTLDDNLQIMEQILPYFTPGMSLNVKVFDNNISDSVSCTLANVTQDIPVDLNESEERLITFIYTFTIKANYYTPKKIYGFTPDMFTNLTLLSNPTSGVTNQYNFDSGTFSKFLNDSWYSIFSISVSSTFFSDKGYPSNDLNYDYYLDIVSNKFYKKINDKWILFGYLPNIEGSNCYKNWILLTSNPVSSDQGDYAINTIDGSLYFKYNNEWYLIFNISSNAIVNITTSTTTDIGNVNEYILNTDNGTLYLKTINGLLIIFTSCLPKYPNAKPLIYNIKSNVYSGNDYIEVDQKWIESQQKIEQKFNYYEESASTPNPYIG